MLQCSRLENPMDRGAWCTTVHMVAKSWTRLSDQVYTVYRGEHGRAVHWQGEGFYCLQCLNGSTQWGGPEVGLPTFSNSLQATHPPTTLGSVQRV